MLSSTVLRCDPIRPNLSILIVNWRSKDYLRRCLATIRETGAVLVSQIVVVDGGSFDGCGEMLAADFPEVEFVQSQENLGFGRCNNLGFDYITGDTVLLLNPDTELKAGALARLMDVLDTHPDAGIVSPVLLNSDGSLQKSSVTAFPTPLNQALRSELLMKLWPRSGLWGAKTAYLSRKAVCVEAVSGACMLMRADLFRRLGGFRPQYFMYAEDVDLCFRVHQLGLANYHVPDAEVVHHGGGSSRLQVSQFSTVMMRIAKETYMSLNHGPLTALYYRLLQAISASVRLLLSLPMSFLPVATRQSSARLTAKKWWYVLKWTLGIHAERKLP